MFNYPIFGGMELDQIIWNYFPSLPAVYDESISYLEFLGNVLKNMNDERKHINEMGEAISLFQKYVLEELKNYDEKIIKEVTEQFQKLIDDGTIANMLNETLFKPLYDKVESFDTRIKELEYVEPVCLISHSPSNNLYLRGETINSLVINCQVSNNTENITKAELYVNEKLVKTVLSPSNNFEIVYSEIISANSKLYVKLYDGKSIVKSNSADILFTNYIYYGLLTELNVDNIVKGNKIKTLEKINKFLSTGTGKIFVAYPTRDFEFKTIINNSIEYSNFSIQEFTINNEQYKVMVWNDEIMIDNDGFEVIFND